MAIITFFTTIVDKPLQSPSTIIYTKNQPPHASVVYPCNVFFRVRTLYNYMMWHLVGQMSSFLSKPFQDARSEFSKALLGAC